MGAVESSFAVSIENKTHNTVRQAKSQVAHLFINSSGFGAAWMFIQ